MAPATAGAAKPAPEAKLAVKAVKVRSHEPRPLHVFSGPDSAVVVTVKLKNTGAAAGAASGEVSLDGEGLPKDVGVAFDVPRLRPGERERVRVSVPTERLEIAGYSTEACAVTDGGGVKARCRKGPSVAVLPRSWTGTTHGTWSTGRAVESLSSTVSFTYDDARSKQEGVFTYLGHGSLSASIFNDDEIYCDYSGSGDFSIDPAQTTLTFSPNLLTYQALGTLREGAGSAPATYPAQSVCTDASTTDFTQEVGDWLQAVLGSRKATDEILAGTWDDDHGHWSWSLRAE